MNNPGVLILASGLSRRFGSSDKLVADLVGKPVLQHVIDTALSLDMPVYGVIPSQSVSRRTLLKAANVTVIDNPVSESGQGSSIAVGVTHMIEAGIDAVMIMLADMPKISPAHLHAVLSGAKESDVVLSAVKNALMPPAMVRGEALAGLREIPPDMGAKIILTAGQYHIVPLPAAQAKDMDRASDLETMRSMIKDKKTLS